MKRLIIIVEGSTEEEFVKEVLRPYFTEHGIYDVRPIRIRTGKTAKGGFVNYIHLKNDARKYLKQEKDIIVTTFVDYFRIPTSVPGYDDCLKSHVTDARIDCLEDKLKKDINDHRFVPYIQKHEFEALLFASNAGFEQYLSSIAEATAQIVDAYSDPEEINTGPDTAPSKRILELSPKYKKVLAGNIMALEIGIEAMLRRCPRFCAWIHGIIDACHTSSLQSS
jgi:hypothetical protein